MEIQSLEDLNAQADELRELVASLPSALQSKERSTATTPRQKKSTNAPMELDVQVEPGDEGPKIVPMPEIPTTTSDPVRLKRRQLEEAQKTLNDEEDKVDVIDSSSNNSLKPLVTTKTKKRATQVLPPPTQGGGGGGREPPGHNGNLPEDTVGILEQMQRRIDQLEQELKVKEVQLHEQKVKHREAIQALQLRAETAERNDNTLKTEVKILEENTAKLTKAEALQHAIQKKHELELEDLEAKLAEARSEKNELELEHENAVKLAERLEADLEKSRAAASGLAQDLNIAVRARDTAMNSVYAYEERAKKAEAHLQSAQADADTLKTEKEALVALKLQHEKHINELVELSNQLGFAVKEMEPRMATLEAELTGLRGTKDELDKLQRAHAQLQQHSADVNAKLSGVETALNVEKLARKHEENGHNNALVQWTAMEAEYKRQIDGLHTKIKLEEEKVLRTINDYTERLKTHGGATADVDARVAAMRDSYDRQVAYLQQQHVSEMNEVKLKFQTTLLEEKNKVGEQVAEARRGFQLQFDKLLQDLEKQKEQVRKEAAEQASTQVKTAQSTVQTTDTLLEGVRQQLGAATQEVANLRFQNNTMLAEVSAARAERNTVVAKLQAIQEQQLQGKNGRPKEAQVKRRLKMEVPEWAMVSTDSSARHATDAATRDPGRRGDEEDDEERRRRRRGQEHDRGRYERFAHRWETGATAVKNDTERVVLFKKEEDLPTLEPYPPPLDSPPGDNFWDLSNGYYGGDDSGPPVPVPPPPPPPGSSGPTDLVPWVDYVVMLEHAVAHMARLSWNSTVMPEHQTFTAHTYDEHDQEGIEHAAAVPKPPIEHASVILASFSPVSDLLHAFWSADGKKVRHPLDNWRDLVTRPENKTVPVLTRVALLEQLVGSVSQWFRVGVAQQSKAQADAVYNMAAAMWLHKITQQLYMFGGNLWHLTDQFRSTDPDNPKFNEWQNPKKHEQLFKELDSDNAHKFERGMIDFYNEVLVRRGQQPYGRNWGDPLRDELNPALRDIDDISRLYSEYLKQQKHLQPHRIRTFTKPEVDKQLDGFGRTIRDKLAHLFAPQVEVDRLPLNIWIRLGQFATNECVIGAKQLQLPVILSVDASAMASFRTELQSHHGLFLSAGQPQAQARALMPSQASRALVVDADTRSLSSLSPSSSSIASNYDVVPKPLIPSADNFKLLDTLPMGPFDFLVVYHHPPSDDDQLIHKALRHLHERQQDDYAGWTLNVYHVGSSDIANTAALLYRGKTPQIKHIVVDTGIEDLKWIAYFYRLLVYLPSEDMQSLARSAGEVQDRTHVRKIVDATKDMFTRYTKDIAGGRALDPATLQFDPAVDMPLPVNIPDAGVAKEPNVLLHERVFQKDAQSAAGYQAIAPPPANRIMPGVQRQQQLGLLESSQPLLRLNAPPERLPVTDGQRLVPVPMSINGPLRHHTSDTDTKQQDCSWAEDASLLGF